MRYGSRRHIGRMGAGIGTTRGGGDSCWRLDVRFWMLATKTPTCRVPVWRNGSVGSRFWRAVQVRIFTVQSCFWRFRRSALQSTNVAGLVDPFVTGKGVAKKSGPRESFSASGAGVSISISSEAARECEISAEYRVATEEDWRQAQGASLLRGGLVGLEAGLYKTVITLNPSIAWRFQESR
jgi:hypothetical protein